MWVEFSRKTNNLSVFSDLVTKHDLKNLCLQLNVPKNNVAQCKAVFSKASLCEIIYLFLQTKVTKASLAIFVGIIFPSLGIISDGNWETL